MNTVRNFINTGLAWSGLDGPGPGLEWPGPVEQTNGSLEACLDVNHGQYMHLE